MVARTSRRTFLSVKAGDHWSSDKGGWRHVMSRARFVLRRRVIKEKGSSGKVAVEGAETCQGPLQKVEFYHMFRCGQEEGDHQPTAPVFTPLLHPSYSWHGPTRQVYDATSRKLQRKRRSNLLCQTDNFEKDIPRKFHQRTHQTNRSSIGKVGVPNRGGEPYSRWPERVARRYFYFEKKHPSLERSALRHDEPSTHKKCKQEQPEISVAKKASVSCFVQLLSWKPGTSM